MGQLTKVTVGQDKTENNFHPMNSGEEEMKNMQDK